MPFRIWLPLFLFLTAAPAAAVTIPASGDRWMYPFNGAAGSETVAPTFGAVGEPLFDDRDSQLWLRFDTSGAALPGAGASSYAVASARVVLALQGGSFVYDPSQDAYATFGAGSDPDAGRPIELFGAAYRNGFGAATFVESSAFAPPGPPAPGVRNAYASDYAGGVARDVSNSVQDAFDPAPFAIGAVAGLAQGDPVPVGSSIVFELTLTPDVLVYLQSGLDAGTLDLVASSLHAAAFGGPATYPRFWTREGVALGGVAPRLEIDVALLPEPGTLALLGTGILGLACRGRRKPA